MEEQFKRDIENDVQQRIQREMQRTAKPPGMVPGIILIALGTLFLLGHMGILDTGRLWKFWPLIIVLVGLVKFFKEHSRVGGAVTIVVGVLLQLGQLGYMQLSWGTLWPVILILAGIAMIWSRFEMPRFPTPAATAGMGTVTGASGYETLNEYAMFGGIERRMHTNNFRGGSIVSVFGGVEVDFRTADIEGEEAVVYVEAIFGGIELKVPERWKVVFQGQSIFGGYSDETRPPLADALGTAPRKTLILRGKAVFGGINVKN